MESVRKRLKEAMDLRGYRQQDMIDKYGFGSSTISQYLSGKVEPKRKALYKLAAALDVRPDWLMGLDVPMEKTIQADITDREFRVVEQMRKLDEYDRGRLAAYMEMFLQDPKYGSVSFKNAP